MFVKEFNEILTILILYIMKTDTKNGYEFAKFISENELYNENYFCEDYDQYLSYSNLRDSFWEDFCDAMQSNFNNPVKC